MLGRDATTSGRIANMDGGRCRGLLFVLWAWNPGFGGNGFSVEEREFHLDWKEVALWTRLGCGRVGDELFALLECCADLDLDLFDGRVECSGHRFDQRHFAREHLAE